MILILNGFSCVLSTEWVQTTVALFLQTNKVMNSLGIESDSGQGVNTAERLKI